MPAVEADLALLYFDAGVWKGSGHGLEQILVQRQLLGPSVEVKQQVGLIVFLGVHGDSSLALEKVDRAGRGLAGPAARADANFDWRGRQKTLDSQGFLWYTINAKQSRSGAAVLTSSLRQRGQHGRSPCIGHGSCRGCGCCLAPTFLFYGGALP